MAITVVNFFAPVSFLVYILVVFCWFGITIFGSFLIGWNYHFRSFCSNPLIDGNYVSITFDDGPTPEFTPKVLALLEKYQAKATFFCVGKMVENHPEILKEIIAKGHTVGNHTYSHSHRFGFFSFNKVVDELRRTNQIIKDITGIEPKLYRPAFGVTNPNIKKALQITELQSIGWNKRSLDTTKLSEEKILNRITNRLNQGDVILLHDTSLKTVKVLEQLLLFLQKNNFQSETVDKLLNLKPYV